MIESILKIIPIATALIVSLTFHEAAHAGMAYILGDSTAKTRGRLSLNPLRHLDTIGTIVFIITQMIGWGKPVPVNPNNFKNPIRDNAFVALAGPLSNFILSIVLLLPLKLIALNAPQTPQLITLTLLYTFHISIFLGVFNLLPFPPLDGSKVLGLFVPPRYYKKYLYFLQDGAKYSIAIFLLDVLVLQRIFLVTPLTFVLSRLQELTSWILLLNN